MLVIKGVIHALKKNRISNLVANTSNKRYVYQKVLIERINLYFDRTNFQNASVYAFSTRKDFCLEISTTIYFSTEDKQVGQS